MLMQHTARKVLLPVSLRGPFARYKIYFKSDYAKTVFILINAPII